MQATPARAEEDICSRDPDLSRDPDTQRNSLALPWPTFAEHTPAPAEPHRRCFALHPPALPPDRAALICIIAASRYLRLHQHRVAARLPETPPLAASALLTAKSLGLHLRRCCRLPPPFAPPPTRRARDRTPAPPCGLRRLPAGIACAKRRRWMPCVTACRCGRPRRFRPSAVDLAP